MEQPCVILATGPGPGQDYLPNFDYNNLNGNGQYQGQQNMGGPEQQIQQPQASIQAVQQQLQQQRIDEKVLPYEQW